MRLFLMLLAVAAVAAQQAGPQHLQTCYGNLLTSGFFNKEQLGSVNNAFLMALLASDAYPATLLGGTNAKYNTLRYEAAVRQRWGALGAKSVTFADDFEDGLEAHAVVVGTGSDVFIGFRGTSTTEGWANNARISPWNITASGAPKALEVHGGFVTSLASVLPDIGADVAKVLAKTVDNAATARVFLAGHSLGGAHAMLTALALSDKGAKIGGVWTFGAPKVGKSNFVDEYMRRFGNITFRWVNGNDLVPTLPPDLPTMTEPFKQLPPESTLWRTLGGACARASSSNGLLPDCPPPPPAAAAAAAGSKGSGRLLISGEAPRCSYAIADHRLFKSLGALGGCVSDAAAARGDVCTPKAVDAILKGSLP